MEAKLPINAALKSNGLEECGVYTRIIRKTSVQLGNLHHPDKLRFHWYLSKIRETLEPLNYIIIFTNDLQQLLSVI